ncbi:hypothetical protein [Foetidibacter luteolus]|uniref:hypothetical protein n=1 Tax=Foetidibacter luteolus TaxID=2608880 RepID=UPI00129AB03E|nr:hypothetical protein [Foetidibacter luteolus]
MDNIIYVNVDEDIRVANFTIIDHPFHLMALVKFEDGYANVFFTDVESGKWVEQDMGFTRLAEETGNQLTNHFKYGFTEYKPLQWLYKPDGKYCFAFHKYISGDYEVYEIYHSNRRHMFTAIRSSAGLWQVILFSGETVWNYDKYYYDEAPYLIDVCKL